MDTREKVRIMQAYCIGNEIEVDDVDCHSESWEDCNNPRWDWLNYSYRVKPKPKIIPLDMDDIILGKSVITYENNKEYYKCLIVRITNQGVVIINSNDMFNFCSYSCLKTSWIINHNNGIGEFVKCEKEEIV